MNVMIVELLTRRKKKNALSVLMALPKYEWAGRRASGPCGHSPRNKPAVFNPFFMCYFHLTTFHPIFLVTTLVLPFSVYAVAYLQLRALTLMGLLSTLGVSKMDRAVKKSFPLNSKTCVVYSIEVYVILTNQKLLLENDFPSFIFSSV